MFDGSVKKKSRINEVDTLMFFIAIIDILFLPYIRMFSVSISMIILPLWFIFNMRKLKINNEFKLLILFFTLSITSFLIAVIRYPEWLIKSNFIYLGILIYGFLYYLFFQYYFNNFYVKLRRYLYIYLLFVFTLAIIYILNASAYFYIRSFWTMSGDVIEVTSSLAISRFTSTFSDPNNAATVVLGVFAFLFFNTKLKTVLKITLIFIVFTIVIATMSSTGLIIFFFLLAIIVLHSMLKVIQNNLNIKKSTLFTVFFAFISLPIIVYFLTGFIESEVVKTSVDRFAMNSTESRLSIWQRLYNSENIFKYIFLGMGGTILLDGFAYRPHNGHLHLIYNYGLISYITFILIFFRIRLACPLINYIFLIPFIIGFTMNVGIYEPRFMNVLSLLVAFYSSASMKNVTGHNQLKGVNYEHRNSSRNL